MKKQKHSEPGWNRVRIGSGPWIGVAVIVAVILFWCFWPGQRESSSPSSAVSKTNVAAMSPFDYQRLLGRWLRPDGGYVLEFTAADPNGNLQAAYFNPRSIKVTEAKASLEEGRVKVFVELNDVGYPGCQYQLTYYAGNDCLVGTYLQAAMRETFEVIFERLKE